MSKTVTPDDRDRALEIYQYADAVSHNRHNIFVVAQSILIGAFGVVSASAHSPGIKSVLVITGLIFVVAWWYISWRLGRKITRLEDKYLVCEGGDPVWMHFQGSTGRKKSRWTYGGPLVLTWVLPSLS